jgi:hypothetical protein
MMTPEQLYCEAAALARVRLPHNAILERDGEIIITIERAGHKGLMLRFGEQDTDDGRRIEQAWAAGYRVWCCTDSGEAEREIRRYLAEPDLTMLRRFAAVVLVLLLLVVGCETYEAPVIVQPADTVTSIVTPDTNTRKVIAGHAYGSPFLMLWRDLNTGWVDTIYQGVTFFRDTVWVPRMEWGELRIETPQVDSVYLRLGCTQGWSVKAISFKISN